MVHRKPASMDAPMTTRKPTRLNSVSPATSSSKPSAMMTTTPAKPQLGLHNVRSKAGLNWSTLVQGYAAQVLHTQAKRWRNKRFMQNALDLLFCSCQYVAEIPGTAELSAPFQTPDEGEDEQEDGRRRLAHGVERQRYEHERVVGQPDVQTRRHAVGHHCAAGVHPV